MSPRPDEPATTASTAGTTVTAAVAGGGLAVFAVLTALVTAPWGALLRLDETVAREINGTVAPRPWLADALNVATDVFAPWVFRVVGLVVTIGLVLRGLPRLALWVLVTIWGGGLLVQLVKDLTGRARPEVPEQVSSAGGFSFPSGHALGATVGCAVLLMLVWPLLTRNGRVIATVAAVTVAVLTSFTRVALGVHYTSDVVAGTALGLAWVAATTALLRPPLRQPPRRRDERTADP